MEKEIDAQSVRFVEMMKDHEHGILETTTDKLLIDFVSKVSRRVNNEVLKAEYPDAYKNSLRESESRKIKVSVQPV